MNICGAPAKISKINQMKNMQKSRQIVHKRITENMWRQMGNY